MWSDKAAGQGDRATGPQCRVDTRILRPPGGLDPDPTWLRLIEESTQQGGREEKRLRG